MKVVFLDRDGVINEYPGECRYVTHHKEFKLIPGSAQGIKKLKEKGFKIFVVSNQAGVAKGFYSEKDLRHIDKKLLKLLKKNGVSVDGVYYCLHKDEDKCDCRKPKTGLLDKALAVAGITPEISFFVGDSFIDMKTAKAFGAKSILVLSGKEKIANRINWEFEPDYIFDNLLLAAHYICSHYDSCCE